MSFSSFFFKHMTILDRFLQRNRTNGGVCVCMCVCVCVYVGFKKLIQAIVEPGKHNVCRAGWQAGDTEKN